MLKILIIDDEISMCDLLKDFFAMHDYQTFIATSAEEGLQIIKKKKPQIVLLDLLMPKMSGFDALKKIKEIDRKIKVIMMTAVNDEKAIALTKKLGASDYITKPFSLKHLEEEVIPKLLKQLV